MRQTSTFVKTLAAAAEAVGANSQPLQHLAKVATSLEDRHASGDENASTLLLNVETAARTCLAEALRGYLPPELNITKHPKYDAMFKQRADLVAQTRRLA